MKHKRILFIVTGLLCVLPVFSQSMPRNRSLAEVFPGLDQNARNTALAEGIILTPARDGKLELIPGEGSGLDLPERVYAKGCPYLAEILKVVPHGENPRGVLDAYNALNKIRNLKGRLYHSYTRNEDVALFEDATRVESDTRNNPRPDPAPVSALPDSETVYIRLRDINFGNTYYRAEIKPMGRGLLFSLSNYRTINYFIFTVMEREKFSAWLYMEPLEEGMMIYTVTGTFVSDFIARQIDIPSAIAKRIAVFVDWINDGLIELP